MRRSEGRTDRTRRNTKKLPAAVAMLVAAVIAIGKQPASPVKRADVPPRHAVVTYVLPSVRDPAGRVHDAPGDGAPGTADGATSPPGASDLPPLTE